MIYCEAAFTTTSRPGFIDDDECHQALHELLGDIGLGLGDLRARPGRPSGGGEGPAAAEGQRGDGDGHPGQR